MFSVVLTDICRSFLRVSKVTEKIKTRSKSTPSENFNSHPLYDSFHLCASYACEKLPHDVEKITREVYNYFAHSPK
jgi:hypothetical protein